MKLTGISTLATLALIAAVTTARSEGPKHRKLTAVPFTEVKIQDEFWAPRIETNREKCLPHNFKWCEQTGRFSNFAKAGGLIEGKFEGIYFNDSDVYKVLEGAAYSLADKPDEKLDKMFDDVVAKIAAAQQENGYLNSYYTLVEPDKKWTNCAVKHELYCAGHLIEAAVAHHRATGKKNLLDVAVKFADRIDEIFGPDKRWDVPGHEELELALVKLYELTGEERYFNLAKFFIDARGDKQHREKLYGEYCQDHVPVVQQSEIVGHSVRAMYLYSGVADVAGYTGEQGYVDAMDRLWESVALKKMYVTGGIGVQGHGEGFSGDYALPNEQAYCETCAAIGMALWNHRLNLMHADAKYADLVERAMFNGILSGIDLGGEKFFYVNPLASSGGHHRQPFFGCACCPTNVVRFIASLPGYVYATGWPAIHVNLYTAGVARIETPKGQTVEIEQQTRYPWDGKVKISLKVPPRKEIGWFQLRLRIPGWCNDAKLTLNGEAIAPKTDKDSDANYRYFIDRGYAVICRYWDSGDVVELDLPMPVRRIEAHPKVEADRGRVAVMRGPIVYCFEGVDNDNRVQNIILPHDPKFTAEHRGDLLGGVTVLKGVDRNGQAVTAVPYYAWDHREPSPMAVWVRQDGKTRSPDVDDPAWKGMLYRPLDPATLGPSEPPTLAEQTVATVSHCGRNDSTSAINDRLEPKSSDDHNVPRLTFWDHRGTTEWVQYEFDAPQKLSAMEIYWFDDTGRGQCRVPKSWKLLARSGEAWKPVETTSAFGVEADKYNRVKFAPVETTGLRIEVQLQDEFSGGILEWKISEG
ncbi:MAG: glycoside hydrolase family 127 protein [Candidatus Nealsonbacteria bacterium]|nr:glycoside hydrolase family 127 protein [Candidatus Nealsonbacteria bacterium]